MRGFCVGGRVWRLIHLATRSTPKNSATATGTHVIQTTRMMSHHLTRDSILVEAAAGRRARVRDQVAGIPAVPFRRRCSSTDSSKLGPRVVVDLERFLLRTFLLRYVSEVHSDPVPGCEPSAHRVDQHVGRLEQRRGFGVS